MAHEEEIITAQTGVARPAPALSAVGDDIAPRVARTCQLSAARGALALASDPLWPKLGDEERRVVMVWEAVAERLAAAADKGLEVQRLCRDFAGVLPRLSKGTIYRKVAALRREGSAGVLGPGVLRRLGERERTALPAAFVAAWRARCAQHQRGKVLSCWSELMSELIGGAIIPGYEGDWRAIWLLEHPGALVPARCPYAVDHRRNAHPRGWSYRNLKALAPEVDVWKAAVQGVAAGRAFLPSLPHTRVGLGPMEVITMDDVWHDVEVLFLQGREQPTHERPVEVGVLDVLTGCHVAWQVWPVRRRADGSREMVDGSVQRFIQAQLFCAIGVSPKGLTELLEHGTAGLSDAEAQRINGILSRYLPPPEGRQWLTVLRSSTTGAPIAKGLFCERSCGNPRHKAMLESSWNLLHNALAALPGATGKDRDHAPADAEGLRREDKALMAMVNSVAKAHPEALEILRQAEFHAVSFLRFKEALRLVKERINARTDHSLEGWEGCGFVRHIAELPGGAELELEAVPDGAKAQTAALLKSLKAPIRLRRMSPQEAFAAASAAAGLVRFPPAAAIEILGPELAQELAITPRATLQVRDRFSRELLTYSALVTTPEGRKMELQRGAKVRAWANPFNPASLLVADLEGHALGLCPLLSAARFGDEEHQRANLGLWQQASAAQRDRLEPLLQPKRERAAQTRQNLAELVSRAAASGGEGAPRPLDPSAGLSPARQNGEAESDFGLEQFCGGELAPVVVAENATTTVSLEDFI